MQSRCCNLLVLFALGACVGEKTPEGDDSSGDSPADSEVLLECDAPTTSTCGTEASLIRGTVRLGEGVSASGTHGTLVVALMHELYSGSAGGGYHTHVTVPDVDLSEGAASFELDMCRGGVMWSEDNCDYSLAVMLDINGNNTGSSFLPDAGEPATRVGDLRLSCLDSSPCLDIVLDCVDGASCVTFADDTSCACEANTCGSQYRLCSG